MTVTDRYASTPWAADRAGVENLLQRPAWMASAACRGMGTAIFFPGLFDDSVELLEQARAVCARCPVVDECRDYAVEAEEPRLVGTWAGTTEYDRRMLRRAGA
ncbi:MAG TPA: WhiB family transcriptional regulator [Acidimicrobiales bacterium]|nr:WhiB family transcriptional regulator [Acidimicrobiales bacterium]